MSRQRTSPRRTPPIEGFDQVQLTWLDSIHERPIPQPKRTARTDIMVPRPPRNAPRAVLPLNVELALDSDTYFGEIQNASRFGAFVRCEQAFQRNQVVRIKLLLAEHLRLGTRATVAHHIDAADAARLGTVTGVGLRFRDPIDDADRAFARVIEELLALTARVIARRPEESPVVLRGSLSEIRLADLLYMLEANGRSRHVVLSRDDVAIMLELVDGKLVDVSCEGHRTSPRDILIAALDWSTGTFAVHASSLEASCG